MNIQIIKGNIVNVAADAVVLPANEKLQEGSGASAAIFQAAGRRELSSACRRIGHCDVGMAVPTPAFHLDADYIIHAVVPKWRDGLNNEYDLLCSAYLSSLHMADEMYCRQIAFPLLASGNNGFEVRLAFEIAIKSIRTFQSENLRTAILVLYGDGVTALAESEGYSVTKISDRAHTDHELLHVTESMRQLSGNDWKKRGEIAEKMLNIGQQWISDPENRKKLIKVGKIIVNTVMG